MNEELEKIVNQCIFELGSAAMEYGSGKMWQLLRSIPFYDLLIEIYLCLPEKWKEKPDIEEQLQNILFRHHVIWKNEEEKVVEVGWWKSPEYDTDENSKRISVYAQLFMQYISQSFDKEMKLFYRLVFFCSYWNDIVVSDCDETQNSVIEQAKRLLGYYNLIEESMMTEDESEKVIKLKTMFNNYQESMREQSENDFETSHNFVELSNWKQNVITGYLNWRKVLKDEEW